MALGIFLDSCKTSKNLPETPATSPLEELVEFISTGHWTITGAGGAVYKAKLAINDEWTQGCLVYTSKNYDGVNKFIATTTDIGEDTLHIKMQFISLPKCVKNMQELNEMSQKIDSLVNEPGGAQFMPAKNLLDRQMMKNYEGNFITFKIVPEDLSAGKITGRMRDRTYGGPNGYLEYDVVIER